MEIPPVASSEKASPDAVDTASEGTSINEAVEQVRTKRTLTRSHYYLTRTTAARATREAILTHVPQAADDKVLLRYVIFALWTSWRDKDTQLRLIDRQALAWIWGSPLNAKRKKHGGVSGRDVLDYIKARLPEFKWKKYVPTRACRQIVCDGLPTVLYRVVQQDLCRPANELEDRVYLVSGKKYRREETVAMRQKHYEAAMQMLEDAPSDVCRWIAERMNNDPSGSPRPSNIFTKMTRCIDKAIAYVLTMDITIEPTQQNFTPAQKRRMAEEVRQHYLSVLRAIQDQPQPFYGPSSKGRTDRIFAVNPSILELPSSVRRLLCDGLFIEVDLKSAHLGICASLWGCSRVAAFLAGTGEFQSAVRGDIWKEVAAHFGLSPDELVQAKPAFKEALYSIVYGMEEASVKGQLTRTLHALLGHKMGKRPVGQHFCDHWIIRELLEARERELAFIHGRGHGFAADGRRINVDLAHGIDERSVMSTIAQSYEAELMKPILEYEVEHYHQQTRAGKDTDWRVALWQHDGCSLHFTRKQRTHMKELEHRVAERAAYFGIPTYLTDK